MSGCEAGLTNSPGRPYTSGTVKVIFKWLYKSPVIRGVGSASSVQQKLCFEDNFQLPMKSFIVVR